MAEHGNGMRSTYVPGLDDYYEPQATPELISPEPQRINHEMPAQIADGIRHMDLNSGSGDRTSTASAHDYHQFAAKSSADTPHLSPFPKLANPPPNVPPSDDELESTLENARVHVLNSNDAEMQLAWAQDALAYCGVCADEAERLLAADSSQAARPATPRVEHQLKTDAMSVVNFLADQHHPKAEFLRGMWLEMGRFGQREDKKEAFRCYSRAADNGYKRAEYRIGLLYESYNDPIKALRHYNRGVDAGDAASCYRLGMMALRGEHGQEQDFRRGLDLMRRSADAADENAAQGAFVYGMLLARDLAQVQVPDSFLPHDERLARELIEKAAYMRFAKAQVKMASCYELGALGCEFQPALSIHYNALASKQGEAAADMSLSKWFLVGADTLLPKNEALAYAYATRAAATGLDIAEFALGYFHEIGIHVSINLDQARKWYEKAAQHGNEDAKGRLIGLANKQILSKRDHENVAISRIRSQHGSVRGGRPQRLQQQQQQQQNPSRLGRVDEGAAAAQQHNHDRYGSSTAHPPARGSSMTPYPLDNLPPQMPGISSRPGSVAPYPLEDTPPVCSPPYTSTRPPIGGFMQQPPQQARPGSAVNPDRRPGSAFQFHPDLRSQSATSVPQLPSAGGPPISRPSSNLGPGGPGPVTRPATTQPLYHDPRMRPAPSNNSNNNRIPSGGGPMNMQSSRPPMNDHAAAAAYPQNQAQYPSRHKPPLAAPVQSIGYIAPFDDRRPVVGAPRTNSMPPPQSQARPPPHHSAVAAAAATGRPDTASSSRPGSTRPPQPPSASSTTTTTTTTQPQKASAATAATLNAKPAGPKTFDEMGVPAQKKEECVVM